MRQEKCLLDIKTDAHVWEYIVEFFLQLEMFRTKAVEKTKINILRSVIFSWKFCRVWDYMEDYGGAR